MLKSTKSVTINGSSLINNEVAATMYAVINEDGSCNQNSNIVNTSLYETNKSEIRDDIATFNDKVYKIQDGTEVEV